MLNYFFTFKSDKGHGEAAAKYFSLLAVGWCINTGLMWFLVHEQGWHVWLAQVLATGLGLVWNFAGSRWWAFKPADAARQINRSSLHNKNNTRGYSCSSWNAISN